MNNTQIYTKKILTPSHISDGDFDNLCCPLSAGEISYSPGYKLQRKNYDSLLLYYVLSGQSYLEYNDERYTLNAGDSFLIDCNRPHIYGNKTKDKCTILYSHFKGGCSKYYFEKLLALNSYVYKGPLSIILLNAIKNLEVEFQKTSLLQIQKISTILYLMLNDLLIKSMPEEEPFALITEYISDCIITNNQITIDNMADLAGYSRYHFMKKFRRHLGITPYEYVIRARIQRCKELLLNSNNSISNIAMECGFNDASHMCNCFKKRERLTPTQFKKSYNA